MTSENPKMLLIFNEQDANEMKVGKLVTYGSHAALWLNTYFEHLAFDDEGVYWNKFGTPCIAELPVEWDNWLRGDYRKIVLVTPRTLQEEAQRFKDLKIPCYLQFSAYEDNKPMCLAVFGTNKQLDPLTKEMKLL